MLPVECLHAAFALVGDHASDGPPKDLAGSSEMEGSSLGVTVHSLPQEGEVLQLVSVE